MPNNLKKNREIILASVKKYGLILEFVPNKFKNDKEIVLQAVKNCGFSLKYASKKLRDDKDIILNAIKSDWALKFVGKKFLVILSFISAVKYHGYAFNTSEI